MIALHVTDVKNFMNLLFKANVFDNFSLVEGDISVAVDYHIDGAVNADFFGDDEKPSERFISWADAKAIVMQMIKGSRLPLAMKLVLRKPGGSDLTYLLNIRFDNGSLLLVTGISRAVFTLDKSGEKEWDDNMKGFLDSKGIEYEIM